MKFSEHKDIVIVGGGVVGMLMALALSKLEKEVTLIDKMPVDGAELIDGRSIALSYTSVCVLNSLGLWEKINDKVMFIEQVHVSDKGAYGQANLFAKDESLPFLGVVIKMQCLLPILQQAIIEQKNIEVWQHSEVVDLCELDNGYSLTISSNNNISHLSAQLIIAADGVKSRLRDKLGIQVSVHDYQQSALVFNLSLQNAHENVAYERFINDGVMAMLPVAKKQMACVWSVDHQQADYLCCQDNAFIIRKIQQIFSYRLGRFVDLSKIYRFPLSLVQAQSLYSKNVLLFGNAAHFLHPISGQGLNLSVRDIGVLYDLLAQEGELSSNTIAGVLEAYRNLRQADHKRTARLTHSMIDIFTQKAGVIKMLRNTALHCLERDQFLKNTFSKLMMGKYNYGSTLMQKKVY